MATTTATGIALAAIPIRRVEADSGCDSHRGQHPAPCRGELKAYVVPFHGRFILCGTHARDMR